MTSATLFSTMVITYTYNQVYAAEEDIPSPAFVTKYGPLHIYNYVIFAYDCPCNVLETYGAGLGRPTVFTLFYIP